MKVRFAPSPTGSLHIGNALGAVANRNFGGTFLLRIDDTDPARNLPGGEEAILADLTWLGITWDEGPVRQSDRDELYASALGRLRAQGLVYACECSRHDVVTAGGGGAGELRYPGTCAAKGLADGPGRGLRVHLPADVLRFDDGLLGPQTQQPSSQCGDLLVRDRDGQWTYQFAAAVDDFAQDAVAGVFLVRRVVGLDGLGLDPGLVDQAIADESTSDEVLAEHQRVIEAGGFGGARPSRQGIDGDRVGRRERLADLLFCQKG